MAKGINEINIKTSMSRMGKWLVLGGNASLSMTYPHQNQMTMTVMKMNVSIDLKSNVVMNVEVNANEIATTIVANSRINTLAVCRSCDKNSPTPSRCDQMHLTLTS